MKRFASETLILLLFLLCACENPQAGVPGLLAASKPSATPFQPVPNPSAVVGQGIWLDLAVPEMLRENLARQGAIQAVSKQGAQVWLEMEDRQTPTDSTSTWIYVLVAAFPTVRDNASFAELQLRWSGSAQRLIMTASTAAAMQKIFGGPAGVNLQIVSNGVLKDSLWHQPDVWGIVPFEELDPEMKVLGIDGRSPIHKDFDAGGYPLKTVFQLQPALFNLPASNRDTSRLTTVLMTGTTALVRAISAKMQQKGIEYPAQDIGDWLRSADILHISNEVAFSKDCPPPDPFDNHLRFCSAADNILLLDVIGTDVIELSGNHVNDWDRQALLYTLDLYQQRGWPVFAGGANEAASKQPAFLERSGVKFSFVGCNASGPDFAWATTGLPGAARCGDYAWLIAEIKNLKAAGDVVIATLQHYEYYSPEARPLQVEDFRRLAEAGAVVVSGSQAHYSQVMEFNNGTFIHYGLGNLFFDQMGYDYANGIRTTNTRREFLDRHVFYAGKLISTELLTAVLEDYSKPRPMTPEERASFLVEYFTASGWIAGER